ncbi:hypothetical protein BJX65DRAFT_280980 [Aspergillus insuetus]
MTLLSGITACWCWSVYLEFRITYTTSRPVMQSAMATAYAFSRCSGILMPTIVTCIADIGGECLVGSLSLSLSKISTPRTNWQHSVKPRTENMLREVLFHHYSRLRPHFGPQLLLLWWIRLRKNILLPTNLPKMSWKLDMSSKATTILRPHENILTPKASRCYIHRQFHETMPQ